MKFTGLLRVLFGEGNEKEPDGQAGKNILEDENEIAAVIAAAVHAYMKPGDDVGLRVVSVKRTGQTTPLWNRAGRLDRISGKL